MRYACSDGGLMAALVQINIVAGVKVYIDKSPFTIGRGEESDLCVDDELVSRTHALIECSQKSPEDQRSCVWILRDQNSTNGTCVGDRKITVHALMDGDVVRIGKTFLKFYSDDHGELGETRVIKRTIIPGIYYTTEKT